MKLLNEAVVPSPHMACGDTVISHSMTGCEVLLRHCERNFLKPANVISLESNLSKL